MTELLDANADGIALAFWLGWGGLVALLVALILQWRASAQMRIRARRREALRRYHELIGADCWPGKRQP